MVIAGAEVTRSAPVHVGRLLGSPAQDHAVLPGSLFFGRHRDQNWARHVGSRSREGVVPTYSAG
jgi:hypothetical protein